MPTVGTDTDPLAPIPAGGVLTGAYPDPGFAGTGAYATDAQLAGKAAVTHTHDASAVTSGQVPIGRVPTSTTPSSVAVPRADDPRLATTGARAWVLYDDTENPPYPGDAPTYSGGVYTPGKLPPGPATADAGFTRKGAVTLTGDLRGSAAAPQVFRTSPINGFTQADPLVFETDCSTISNFHLVVSATLSEFSFDALVQPTNMLDGQVVTFEFHAVGAQRRVGIVSTMTTVANGARRFTVPQNKSLFLKVYYSARTQRMFLFSASMEP